MYCTSMPDFLFSVLSVMLSRSPKRSLVMNWWCVGTMLVCRLDAVSASSCSRFSRRCSSKIFCQETRLNCLHPPDMGLYSFIHRAFVRHTRVSLIQNTIIFIKVFVFRGLIHEFEASVMKVWIKVEENSPLCPHDASSTLHPGFLRELGRTLKQKP